MTSMSQCHPLQPTWLSTFQSSWLSFPLISNKQHRQASSSSPFSLPSPQWNGVWATMKSPYTISPWIRWLRSKRSRRELVGRRSIRKGTSILVLTRILTSTYVTGAKSLKFITRLKSHLRVQYIRLSIQCSQALKINRLQLYHPCKFPLTYVNTVNDLPAAHAWVSVQVATRFNV